MRLREKHFCFAKPLVSTGFPRLFSHGIPNLFCQFQNKTKNMELWEREAQPKVHLERKNFMNRVFALQRSVLLL